MPILNGTFTKKLYGQNHTRFAAADPANFGTQFAHEELNMAVR